MAKKAKTGKELERRVADAYREMGACKVEHDVELAGNQIDVYVELETPGRLRHRIVVEAKDWTSPVGIRVVNDFVEIVKLLHHERLIDEGIIISALGFTRPARNAAKRYDIRLLELADLEVMAAETKPVPSPTPLPVGPISPTPVADQLYARACDLYNGKDWRGVLDTWEQIKQTAPGYSDSRGIVALARNKLKEEFRRTIPRDWPPWEVFFLMLVGIVLVVMGFIALRRNSPGTFSLACRIALPPPGVIDQVFDKQTGVFLLPSSPDLQIWEISYPRADGITARHTGEELSKSTVEELPVVLETQERWKIRPKLLLEQGKISLIDIPPVPQTVNVTISKREGSRNLVLLYVFTDAPYLQPPPCKLLPVPEGRIVYENVHIGQMGVMSFIELEGDEYKITTASNPDIIELGAGPIAALCAVEFVDGKPLTRSRVVLVRRQGILHPDDIWFDREKNEPYISSLFGRFNQRKVAFQSLGEDGRQNDVFLAGLDGGSVANTTRGLPRSENLIVGWGNKLPIAAEKNAIYFESSCRGGTRKLLYKVLVYDNGLYSEPIQVSP